MGTAAIARKFVRGIYGAVTLFASHIVFDEIGVLQAHEFDGEAIFDVAYDAPLRLADCYDDADRRAQIGCDTDGRTGLRQVDHTASDICAIWQDKPRHRLSRGKAIMTAIFRQIEDLPVCEPGKLRRKLVSLA